MRPPSPPEAADGPSRPGRSLALAVTAAAVALVVLWPRLAGPPPPVPDARPVPVAVPGDAAGEPTGPTGPRGRRADAAVSSPPGCAPTDRAPEPAVLAACDPAGGPSGRGGAATRRPATGERRAARATEERRRARRARTRRRGHPRPAPAVTPAAVAPVPVALPRRWTVRTHRHDAALLP